MLPAIVQLYSIIIVVVVPADSSNTAGLGQRHHNIIICYDVFTFKQYRAPSGFLAFYYKLCQFFLSLTNRRFIAVNPPQLACVTMTFIIIILQYYGCPR